MGSQLIWIVVLCGRWEQYPREFAKCRRCRKAKYCGKECQSTAWSEGHRFWCSARDADEEGGDKERGGETAQPTQAHHTQIIDEAGDIRLVPNGDATGTANQVSPRAERAARRERERERMLRDLDNDLAQRLPGFTTDPMFVPVSIAQRAAAMLDKCNKRCSQFRLRSPFPPLMVNQELDQWQDPQMWQVL